MSYPVTKVCPYCKSEVIKTTNDKIYGRIYGNGQVYMCTGCDAYVGCHDHGEPLGRLANAKLRKLKKDAHALFDPIWKTKKMSRQNAYAYLAKALGIHVSKCHFGWFDEETLIKAINVLQHSKYTRK